MFLLLPFSFSLLFIFFIFIKLVFKIKKVIYLIYIIVEYDSKNFFRKAKKIIYNIIFFFIFFFFFFFIYFSHSIIINNIIVIIIFFSFFKLCNIFFPVSLETKISSSFFIDSIIINFRKIGTLNFYLNTFKSLLNS